jgi:hypothetical protein
MPTIRPSHFRDRRRNSGFFLSSARGSSVGRFGGGDGVYTGPVLGRADEEGIVGFRGGDVWGGGEGRWVVVVGVCCDGGVTGAVACVVCVGGAAAGLGGAFANGAAAAGAGGGTVPTAGVAVCAWVPTNSLVTSSTACSAARNFAKLCAPYARIRCIVSIWSCAGLLPPATGFSNAGDAEVDTAAASALVRAAAAARAFAECGGGASFLRSSRSSSKEMEVPAEGGGSGSLRKEERNGDEVCVWGCACAGGDVGAGGDSSAADGFDSEDLAEDDVDLGTFDIGSAAGGFDVVAGCVGGAIGDVVGSSADLKAFLVSVDDTAGDEDFSEDDFTVATGAAAALMILLVVALAVVLAAAVVVVDFDATFAVGSVTESSFGIDFLARFVVVVVAAFVVGILPSSVVPSTTFLDAAAALGFFTGSSGMSSSMLGGLARAAVVALRTPDVFCTDMVASVG